jgi:nitrate/nitrite transporter NarK
MYIALLLSRGYSNTFGSYITVSLAQTSVFVSSFSKRWLAAIINAIIREAGTRSSRALGEL